VPFAQEIKIRGYQLDMFAEQPYYQQQLPEIQAKPESNIRQLILNLDKHFDDEDINNLNDISFELPSKFVNNQNDMSFELPSKLVENKSDDKIKGEFIDLVNKINAKERSLRSLKSNKKSEREGLTEMYTSQYKTLKKYGGRLNQLLPNAF